MECMARKRSSDGNTSTGSQSHLAHVEETSFARSRDAVTIRARGQNEGKSTAANHSDTQASARNAVPGNADPNVLDIRRDSPTACREAIIFLGCGLERCAFLIFFSNSLSLDSAVNMSD